ncbi:MAG: porin [Micavibrio sp.]|nr:porin [Micavibrio sp.]
MKKLLLTTAACGLAMSSTAAHAEVDLDIGGYFKGYGAYVSQDEALNTDVKDVDFIRDTEIHFTGETTLDNGLTVGFHTEATTDGGDNFGIDETYAYFSGSWGRVNFGDEDGAAYLLQVSAPAADENIDGIRQFVQPVNYGALPGAAVIGTGMDYDMDPSRKSTKLTYLTPILNGFQAGLTYSPDTDRAAGLNGVGTDDQEDIVEETYEASVRYEGQFNNVGVILGAGYSHGEIGSDNPLVAGAGGLGTNTEDRKVWNVGADFDIGPFGIGAIYKDDNAGLEGAGNDDEETWVVGVDYTTGPFKLGASYFDQDNTFGTANIDTKRYSGGVTYTYGPGMTFRGSVGQIEHDYANANDDDATYVTLGTQINF